MGRVVTLYRHRSTYINTPAMLDGTLPEYLDTLMAKANQANGDSDAYHDLVSDATVNLAVYLLAKGIDRGMAERLVYVWLCDETNSLWTAQFLTGILDAAEIPAEAIKRRWGTVGAQ